MPIWFSNVSKLPTCVGSDSNDLQQAKFIPEKNIYFYIIDYIKAFDCVDHNKWFSQSIQLLSHVQLFANPPTAAQQASLSITNFQNLLKLMSIESMMPSNHFIFCCPLLLPPLLFPNIRVFSKEAVFLHQLAKVLKFWLQYQSFQWIFRTDFL